MAGKTHHGRDLARPGRFDDEAVGERVREVAPVALVHTALRLRRRIPASNVDPFFLFGGIDYRQNSDLKPLAVQVNMLA